MSGIKEVLNRPRGVFEIKVIKANELKDGLNQISKQGLVGLDRTKAINEFVDKAKIDELKKPNLIVQTSHLILTHLIGQTASTSIPEVTPNNFKITKMRFGEDGTAPSPTQTALISPVEKTPSVFDYAVETPEYQNGASPGDLDAIIKFSTLMAGTDGNGVNYQEAGLFAEAGYMFARTTFPLITKTEEIAFSFNWTIIFP